MSRKSKNDRYYLLEIHKHSEKIGKELKKLKSNLNELKPKALLKDKLVSQLNQLESEKNGLEKETQKSRFILNILNNKSRWGNVQNEIEDKSAENKDLLIRLEDIYVSRKSKERGIDALQKEIREENAMLERDLDKLSASDQQEFYRRRKQLERLKKEIAEKDIRYVESNSKADFYFNKLDHPLKKSLFNLISEYESLKSERESLAELLRNKGTVKHEEESLLEAIREARQQLQSLEAENKQYQQKLDSSQEVIQGLEKDLKEGYSARHGKYLELMRREQKMNQYIESALEKIENNKRLIENAGNAIVEGLNYWSLHLDEVESEFDADDITAANQEYQLQTARLQSLKQRIESAKLEIEELWTKKADLEKQIMEQEDPADAKESLQSSIETCKAEKEMLNKKIAATISAIEVAFKNNKELTEQLNRNKAYGQIKNLEEKILDYEAKKMDVLTRIDDLMQQADTENLAKEIFVLIQSYNDLLKTN